MPSKPPLAGKPGAIPGPGPGMQQGKPGPGAAGQYPGVAAGASGNPGLPGSSGSGEGGQGAYPAYLQQQNQLLARHLQQPMGLPLNRLTPQQTQQVRLPRPRLATVCKRRIRAVTSCSGYHIPRSGI